MGVDQRDDAGEGQGGGELLHFCVLKLNVGEIMKLSVSRYR
jgi:hypothetical protein